MRVLLAFTSLPFCLQQSTTLLAELQGPLHERGLYGTGICVVNAPKGFRELMEQAGNEMAAILFPEAEVSCGA